MSKISKDWVLILNENAINSHRNKKDTSDSFKSIDSATTCDTISLRKEKKVSFYPLSSTIFVESYKAYNKINSYNDEFFKKNEYYYSKYSLDNEDERCFNCIMM